MGNACSSGPVLTEDTQRINRSIQQDRKKYEEEIRLLLLGAGESGKSTIAKQMKIIHLNGFDDAERAGYRETIHYNVVNAMRSMTLAAKNFKLPMRDAENQMAADRIATDLTYSTGIMSQRVSQEIASLWADPAIQQAFARRNEYQLTDSTAYWMNDLPRITAAEYLPTEQDVLRSRVKTTGIIETTFYLDNLHFRMMDVGGQRSERKKWMHCFQGVTAVIFCVALSEYDLRLHEDETVNRMHESLKLFREICNSRWFVETAMILFLNKKDLFAEKIEKVNITVCFPEYQGPQAFEPASKYISEQFLSQNEDQKKLIYMHYTCATDTKNVLTIFNAVNDTLLTTIMRSTGLDY